MKFKLLFTFLVFTVSLQAQLTGLSGWNIFIDPGHSQDENMGIYNYSEAKKNLRVALNLRDMLRYNTDIDTVYLSRSNDQVQVSLSQRTDKANNLGAAWFHSIHSDAGATNSNSTLLMYGGWRNNGQTVEKTPHGGKVMADIMVDLLTRGMRTDTRGNYADRTFYQGFPYNHANQYPYLHVNRESVMASELSEAGFHTNPRQNQLNMNAEWKRLEAYTFYWSILKYHGIQRPAVSIATGIISEMDSSVPINGATVHLDGQTYTTDTYASLFHQYSSDPQQLHNGFYFMEDVTPGTHQMIVESPYHYPDTLNITMIDTFFTFKDVKLISNLPPRVVNAIPANGDSNFVAYEEIEIEFSRPVNTASVEAAFTLNPAANGVFQWFNNNKNVRFYPDSLQFLTNYTLKIDSSAVDLYGHFLDGNADSVAGDSYFLQFKTGPSDIFAPEITDVYPLNGSTGLELNPILSFVYDEIVDPATVSDSLFDLNYVPVVPPGIPGILKHYVQDNRSVFNFFPEQLLEPEKLYRTKILAGMRDMLGNEVPSLEIFTFNTGNFEFTTAQLDYFDGANVTSNWWEPQQSGSTAGIISQQTSRHIDTTYVNHLTGSTQSLLVNYGWDENASEWLIREYLGGGTPYGKTFTSDKILQVYVFGDGSGNKFRFAVDDRWPNTAAGNHEVSPWFTVDWYGWRLVSWDMQNGGTGSWLGDGTLDGTLHFDSIQLTHEPGAKTSGSFYFDDLSISEKIVVNIGDENSETAIPDRFSLEQNYPNPFNPETIIRYNVPQTSPITIDLYDVLGRHVKTIVNEVKNPGVHQVTLRANDLAGGIYFYRMDAGSFTQIRKLMLIK